jgi:hypothetical protein
MRTAKEYWDSVESYAREVFDAVQEGEDEGDALHERIDQSDWIIYTAHSLAVLNHTESDDAAFDEMGSTSLEGCESTAEVYTRLAFYAMRADVADYLNRHQSEWAGEE